MLEKKKKITKKEMKQDKLVTSFYKTKFFYEKHQTKIFAAVIILAAVVFGVIYFTNQAKEANLQASAELAWAVEYYNSGDYTTAINGNEIANKMGLKKIAEEYGSSEQGNIAKIYLANIYFALDSIDYAYEYYDSYSGDNELLQAAGYAGKAGCLEAKENFKDAASLFEKAALVSEENPSSAEYLLKAAINYIKLGNKEKAKEVLERIKTDYPNTLSFQMADKYLALVK